jgi:hypothetical protein
VFAPCGELGVGAGVVGLALDEPLFKEFASRQSEPSKRWWGEGSCSAGRLGGSSRRGGSLRPSKAPKPPDTV